MNFNRTSLDCHHGRSLVFVLLIVTLLVPTFNASAFAEDKSDEPLDPRSYTSGRDMRKLFRPVAIKAGRSTLRLRGDKKKNIAMGTVIAADGWVVTKASELEGDLTVRLRNGKEVAAEIRAKDETTDLALVKVDTEDLQPAMWATGDVEVGQWAISAGPAVDPIALGVVSVLPRQIKGRKVFIGVMLEDVEGGEGGVRVERVLPGLGAKEAGIETGDVIIAADGQAVSKREELTKILEDFSAGEVVKIKVKRDGKEKDFDVELMAPPSRPANPQEMFGSELSDRTHGFESVFQHDTVVRPADCGGPVVDLDGRVIGINIARAGRVASYAIPTATVLASIEKMQAEIEKGEKKVEESPAEANESTPDSE